MNQNQLAELAVKCLSTALGVTIDPEVSPIRGIHEGWDSLKQVELMFVVEDETGEIMTPDQLASVIDLDSLISVLNDIVRLK